MTRTAPKIVISKLKESAWERQGTRSFLEYRDLGIAKMSEGRFSGTVARAMGPREPGHGAPLHYHGGVVFKFAYVLKGSMRNTYEGIGEIVLEEGDTVAYEGELIQAHGEYSPDFEILQISMPADFTTVNVDASGKEIK